MIQGKKEQELLLKIVETWRISQTPEYRGFRCANCQQYKNEAYYHWLNFGDYKLPVHMCADTCEPEFQAGNIQIDESKIQYVDRDDFINSYSPEAEKRFGEIVYAWEAYEAPKLKAFVCDECGKDLDMEAISDGTVQRKGYHVWWKMPDGKTLAELHFHKECMGLIANLEELKS